MATKTEQNIEVLTKAGLKLKGDETPLVIAGLVRKLEKGTKIVDGAFVSSDGKEGSSTGGSQATSGNLIVWLKSKAYIEPKKRLDAGVYMFDVLPARFSKLPASACEVFEKAVPSKKVAQIARWAGINADGVEDEEILSKVITEAKPY